MAKPALLILAALPLLAGCTFRDAKEVVGLNPPYPPPSPTGAFDASYYGRSRLTRAQQGAQCPQSRIGVVEVGDKRLSFAYAPTVIFNPPINPDGSFHAQVGPSVLDGRIVKDTLTMTVHTPQCDSTYDLSTIGNLS